AFGIVGLETMLPISLDLERAGVLSMSDLIATMTANPAQLLDLPEGKLSSGNAADICIFDARKTWVLDREKLFSKGRNTPWHGRTMTGQVLYTLKDGRVVFEKGNVK
ncbi:MAG TPA: dihydroorotase, partial [Ghiorsea sp.]|nr:dihydroorotase [Ghiorsea sp.]